MFLYKGIVCLSQNQFFLKSFPIKTSYKEIRFKKKTRKQFCLVRPDLLFCRAACIITDKWCMEAPVCGHCEAPCHYCHQHFLLQIKRLCPQGFCKMEVREREGRECGLASGRRECPTTKIGKCKIRTSIYHQGKENLL